MTLDQAISEISHITGDPLNIQRIDHALSNKVYKLSSENAAYALRINNPNSVSLGINRENEVSILKLIEKQPWSPKIEYISSRLLLTHWYQQKTIVNKEDDLSHLLDLLESVHQIRFSEVTKLQTMNIAEHILSYLTQIDVPAAFTDAAKNLCFHYQTPKEKTLCHHDWHKGNLIRTELELILLDWEYAAIGDPLIDIACFINGLELKEPDIQKVSQRFHLNPDQLSQAITLTELMSFTWYLVRFADKDWSVQIQSWISRLKSL